MSILWNFQSPISPVNRLWLSSWYYDLPPRTVRPCCGNGALSAVPDGIVRPAFVPLSAI